MPFAWDPPPLVVGHRGSPFEATENTIPSFRAAVAAGARAVELDARLSRDGVVVVHHDAALGRTLGGAGLVEERDADELRALGVPTLAEVFAALPDLLVDVELKADAENAARLPEATLDVVRRAGALDRALVTSFDADLAQAYGDLADRPVGCIAPFPVEPGDLPPRARFVLLAEEACVEGAIANAARGGAKVLVWTVNDAARAEALLAEGAVGVITDRPGALARSLPRRAGAAP